MRYRTVRTETLTKFYGHQPGINGLTLEVEPGEVYGLLGLPGAGKTTLLRVLLDLVRPTSGRALVLGLDSHRQSMQIRRQVGYAPARLTLDERLTGLELLRYLNRLRSAGEPQAAPQLAERLGLDLGLTVAALAPAERRKLILVQALMNPAELILLDEPCTDLDDDARMALYRLIGEARSEGRSIVYASSNLCEMERICDRTAVLHQGQVLTVERGVSLRTHALRRVEMRFAGPVAAEVFAGLSNLRDLHLEENSLRCMVQGDVDSLIKIASQFRITDLVSQQPSLEEVYSLRYGVPGCVA